jgi:hypothetical protein
MTSRKSDKPRSNRPGKVAFTYICQRGPLEIQSLLLTASIQRFVDSPHECIAVVPEIDGAKTVPSKETISCLNEMGATIQHIKNPVTSKKKDSVRYLLTNKIYSLRVNTEADKIVFLDTDTLCTSQFSGHSCLSTSFNAYQAGEPGTRPTLGKWSRIYDVAGVKMPQVRLEYNFSGTSFYLPPYVNTGFIGIHKHNSFNLSNTWEEMFIKLDESAVDLGYFTEQVSLSVALHHTGIEYNIRDSHLPSFLHYFSPSNIKSSLPKSRTVLYLIKENPKLERVMKYLIHESNKYAKGSVQKKKNKEA